MIKIYLLIEYKKFNLLPLIGIANLNISSMLLNFSAFTNLPNLVRGIHSLASLKPPKLNKI
jgi:hypothetical protein